MKKSLKKIAASVLSLSILLSGTFYLNSAQLYSSTAYAEDEDPFVPDSYNASIRFYRNYGSTRVSDDQIVLVIKNDEVFYKDWTISYSDEKALVSNETYHGKGDIISYGNQDFYYDVYSFKPQGDSFSITVEDKYNKIEYTFEKDAQGKFIETDCFAWIPDSIAEYVSFTEKYPNGFCKGEYAVFCSYVDYSKGETIYLDQSGSVTLSKVFFLALSNPEEKFLSGPKRTVSVYKANGTGNVTAVFSVLDLFEFPVNLIKSEFSFSAETEMTTEAPAVTEPVTDTTADISTVTTVDTTADITTDITADTSEYTDTDNQSIIKEVTYNCGDIDKNGVVELTDLSYLSLYLLKQYSFDEAQMVIADVTGDEQVDIADLATLKQIICKDPDVVIRGKGYTVRN